jgi:NADPH:quinone reductase-like Zn-dependent oxidoreductase
LDNNLGLPAIHRPGVFGDIPANDAIGPMDMMMMKTFQFDRLGSLDGLKPHDAAMPKPGPGEVVVRMRAASLNVRDLMIAEQRYPVPGKAGIIALSDGAGEIAECGPDVTRFKTGDRVTATYFPQWKDGRLDFQMAFDQYGCTRDGAATEYALYHQEALVALPEHLSFEEGATLTCAALTAWSALTTLPRGILPGERVLTMGSGGVPLFALQFAKTMGAEVIALTSSASKAPRLKALGADHVIDTRADPDWEKLIPGLTDGRGIDHIIETGGIKTIEHSLRAVGADGQIASIGVMRGDQLKIDAAPLGSAYATIRRVFVGSRASFEAMNRAIALHRIRPVIDHVRPFENTVEALHAFKAQNHFGKIVLSIA